MYQFLYITMLISYFGISMFNPDPKLKFVGILLTVVNGVIFWR